MIEINTRIGFAALRRSTLCQTAIDANPRSSDLKPNSFRPNASTMVGFAGKDRPFEKANALKPLSPRRKPSRQTKRKRQDRYRRRSEIIVPTSDSQHQKTGSIQENRQTEYHDVRRSVQIMRTTHFILRACDKSLALIPINAPSSIWNGRESSCRFL